MKMREAIPAVGNPLPAGLAFAAARKGATPNFL
jgi:hypothetical protein